MEIANDILIKKPSSDSIKGKIKLDGSKSISNRVLILNALAKSDEAISGLSSSKDSQILQSLLSKSLDEAVFNAGHAGTCYRFMTAYLAVMPGTQILTGSDRMKQRPIKPLVDALAQIGIQIEYLGEEGYPPLRIPPFIEQSAKTLKIDGTISSQFISALVMIAPSLPLGLEIEIIGDWVSKPYLNMTLSLLTEFGVKYKMEGQTISISNQEYQSKPYQVEADWSAASYYFSLVGLSDSAEIALEGLFEHSLQGDAGILALANTFGIEYTWDKGLLTLVSTGQHAELVEFNFIDMPDLAQTCIVLAAAKNMSGLFSGLQTLKIKETDRIQALQNELGKFGVYLSLLPDHMTPISGQYMLDGQMTITESSIETYKDHRMAMAFAPVSLFQDLVIKDSKVVEKSYANFWKDLSSLGFVVEQV